jgi:hypothetical protein
LPLSVIGSPQLLQIREFMAIVVRQR